MGAPGSSAMLPWVQHPVPSMSSMKSVLVLQGAAVQLLPSSQDEAAARHLLLRGARLSLCSPTHPSRRAMSLLLPSPGASGFECAVGDGAWFPLTILVGMLMGGFK